MRRCTRARSTPMVEASSQPLSVRCDTSTRSGPRVSARRAASASATILELKYWFAMNTCSRAAALAVGVEAQRVVGRMARRVPAPLREIEAADERDGIVDHDDLLVMRRGHGMARVEAEHQSPMRAPVELVHRQPFALQRVQHREI